MKWPPVEEELVGARGLAWIGCIGTGGSALTSAGSPRSARSAYGSSRMRRRRSRNLASGRRLSSRGSTFM
jgi:hypothetical protein